MSQSATNPTERKPAAFSELLRAWRYFFWLLALVLLVCMFYQEENWRGQRAWNNYQKELVARGVTVTPSAFVPTNIPDEQNFTMTPLLAPLFKFIPGTQKWAQQPDTDFFPQYDAASKAIPRARGETNNLRTNSWLVAPINLSEWYEAFLCSATNSGAVLVLTNKLVMKREQAAAGLLKEMAVFAPVLDEFRAASKRGQSRFNIRYDTQDPASILLPHLAVLKHISQVLQLRASAEIAAGQTSEALEDILLILFLADSVKDEPIIVSQLVRISQFQLALQPMAEGFGQWTEPQLKALQERLQQFDFLGSIRRSIEAERAFFGGPMIDYVRNAPDRFQLIQAVGTSGERDTSVAGALLVVAPTGWFHFEQVNHGRIFDEYLMPMIESSQRQITPGSIRKAEKEMEELANHSHAVLVLRHKFFTGLLLPSISKLLPKTAFAQTSADLAAVACALERYRLAHKAYPEVLNQLAPTLIDNLPNDVITGNPLKYRRLGNSAYELYSVGWNEIDDLGAAAVVKESEAPAGDWVWR